MSRSFIPIAVLAFFLYAAPVGAAPTIGSVMPTTATAGAPVTFSATVNSAVAIDTCTLWVDLAEIGEMTVSNGTASRAYTFASGGSRIAFVFCRDVQGGIASGATTAINVSGAIQQSEPLSGGGTQNQGSNPESPESEEEQGSDSSPEEEEGAEPEQSAPSQYTGQLLKAICPDGADMNDACRAVYYIGKDGKRHAFPSSRVFFTWYSNFASVISVEPQELSVFPLGENVKYRAGVRMVKFSTDPKVYAVARGGVLRWITSESLARTYYGDAWNTHIDDIPDSFYANYTFGSDIVETGDYNPEAEFNHSKE